MCESGSMVEHCLPKATVASSNLVFRSKKITFFIKNTRKLVLRVFVFYFITTLPSRKLVNMLSRFLPLPCEKQLITSVGVAISYRLCA